ncbi:MAG: MTAP family purine nucleoside phosphorylase [Longimicrobiales bacterium]|nr:MTAP family purine nucleoside phosphorylase [Longimicrobiales bacterium]
MALLGIVGGSAFLEGGIPGGAARRSVRTRLGDVELHEGDGFVFVRRHGERYVPPHRVPHGAHALALASVGVGAAVGLCSVGALRPDLEPGTAVVPGDYLSLAPPPTLAEGDERLHIVPSLDAELRALLLEAAPAGGGPVEDGGVYAETRGPRFETRAEIRLLADYADVVGMTAAAEATVFQEAGLRYAVLGVVDNFAHGVGAEALTTERFEAQLAANRGRARAILRAIIERWEG